MPIDLLIVGQGLAGSILAWLALQQGLKVIVVDEGGRNASQVAAGLINPLSGLRLLKAPEVDELLPLARATYQQLELQLGQTFWFELPMLRLLNSRKQVDYASQRLQDCRYQAYLEGWETDLDSIVSPYGGLRQTGTAYLKTQPLLIAIRDHLIDRQAYRCERFDYAALQFHPCLQWQDVRPQRVVFCEGHGLRRNPWFSGLPLQPVQGDILTVYSPRPLPSRIINFGHWLLPVAIDQARLGATFNHTALDNLPSSLAKQQLLASIARQLPNVGPLQVIEQACGIRPATVDKQPLIGTHPVHSVLSVFNGFGARGSLAIPAYAKRLLRYWQFGEPLPAQADLARYACSAFQ